MNADNDAKRKRRRASAAIRRCLRRYKKGLAVGALCLVASNVLLQLNPWILKITIDGLQQGFERGRLLYFAVAFIAVALVSGIFRYLMRRILIGISRRIELDIRADFFAHLEKLSPSFYDRHRTGDLMALATNDLAAVRALVGPGVMYSMNTLVVGSLAFSLMVVLSWKLTIIALLPMAVLAAGMYHSMKLIHRYFERVQERFAALNSRAQENLSGIRVVRAYAREDHEIGEFRALSDVYVRANMKLYKIQSLLSPLLTSVAGLGGLLILGYGGKQVIDGTITLGTYVAFNGYLVMLIWPTIALGWVMNIMERGLASMQRINDVLESMPEIVDTPGTEKREQVTGSGDYSITFDGVGFAYSAGEDREDVLKGIDLVIRDGETVAIVGPTGSGKTTLVSLIVRLYEPQRGRVLVGGVPVDEIPLEELRGWIGLIPQDIFLFSQTVRDNVALGASTLDDAALERVAEIAAVRKEIESFPAQYDTMIGERGINLSGGQKQRLAIARALAKDPEILILDDALSSVDTDTEERILQSLRAELKNRTSIIISHRISTVREADRIFVLDDGRIGEQGTHEELIAAGGLYSDMYRKQQIMYNLERE